MLNIETRQINLAMLFLLILSCFMQAFFVDIGFALKPFIVVTVLTLPLTLWLNFKPRKLESYEKFFLLFAMAAINRGSVSLSSVRFLRSAMALVTVSLLYICIRITAERLPARLVTRTLMWAGLLFLITSLVLYAAVPTLGGLMDRGTLRLKGTTIDPNILVAFVLPLLVVACGEFFRGGFLSQLVSLLAVACIALTYSRGGLISIGAVTTLSWVRVALRNSRTVLITVLLVLFVVMVWQIVEPDISPLYGVWNRPGASSGSGRLDIWRHGLTLFADHPTLGIGLDNFRTYAEHLYNDDQYMHNTYLEVLVENGMVGCLLFVACVLSLLLRNSNCSQARWLKLSLCGQLTAIFFLSGLTLEAVYLVAALYTACNRSEVEV